MEKRARQDSVALGGPSFQNFPVDPICQRKAGIPKCRYTHTSADAISDGSSAVSDIFHLYSQLSKVAPSNRPRFLRSSSKAEFAREDSFPLRWRRPVP